MRPVDIEAHQAEIDQLKEEKRDLENEINQLDSFEGRLLALEVERSAPNRQLISNGGRAAALIDFSGDYAKYVVVALPPEDAAAFSDHHERITEI